MLLTLLACKLDAPPIYVPPDTAVETEPPALIVNELDVVGSDWFELYNAGGDVDLDGWSVECGDDSHVLEDLSLEAGGHLVLYADDDPTLGPDHLGVKLSAEGGEVWLREPDGTGHATVSWPQQAAGVSVSRSGDGGDTWFLTTDPTRGEPNEVRAGEPNGKKGDCGLTFSGEGVADEGETLSIEVSCATAESELELLIGPDDATFDGTTLSWETGASSAQNTQAVFGATANPGHVPESAAVSLDVTDMPELGGLPVDPETYTSEWGVPVIHIETFGELHQSYVSGAFTYMGETWEADVKIRGASSASFPKPSMTVEFTDQEFAREDWEKTRNHLVLLSTFDDNAYVRQRLVYEVWNALAEAEGEPRITPRTWFTVVYMNGEYLGLYVGLDKVDDEQMDHLGWNRDGNLYKAVNHDANFYLDYSGGGAKSSLAAGYEKKEGDDDWSDLEALVAFTGGSDSATLVAEADDHLDYDEFMDWFLLVAYALSEDSAGKNSYLYNDPLADGAPHFHAVPWDHNHSWGQNWYTARRDVDRLNEYQSTNRVFWAMKDADEDRLKARLLDRMGDGGPLDAETHLAWMDGWYADIDRSARRDWALWETSYRSHWWADYRDDWTSYDEEVAYLYDWVEQREAYMRAWAEE
ncbi:MAG: hypothetical protein GY913_27795 [Proteobacteria bacterium]|nr:hypothetical protein [Pseudomonadota bacterium]MCP4920716.1 hypothetical protein [Pseudomonadota bacterium]